MRYIRTIDGRIINFGVSKKEYEERYPDSKISYDRWFELVSEDFDIIKQADTIEELCDEFVCQENDNFYWLASRENVSFRVLPNCYCKAIFGAIWTDKGLIYVAKMNEKGELELL